MGATAKQAKTTFKVGDKAVYPAHGVGVIEAIENKQIGGGKHKFYMLRILENDMTIMIPLGNVEAVGLRTVIDRKMVSRINRILREQDIRIDTQTWNRRYREYTEKIKTGSVLEIAEVLRDLCVLKRKKKELSFGERKMLDTARSLLVKEISIAKGMKEADVMTDLERVLGEGHVANANANANGDGNGNGKVNGRAPDGEGAAPVSAKAPAASARPPAATSAKPAEKPKAKASSKPAEPRKAAKGESKPKAPSKAKAAAPKAKPPAKAKPKEKAPAKPKAKAPAKPKAKAPAAKKAKAPSGKGAAAAGAGTRAAAKKSSTSTTKKGAKAAQSKARRKK